MDNKDENNEKKVTNNEESVSDRTDDKVNIEQNDGIQIISDTESIKEEHQSPQVAETTIKKAVNCSATEVSVDLPNLSVLKKIERSGKILVFLCLVSLIGGIFVVSGRESVSAVEKKEISYSSGAFDFGTEDGVALVNVYGVISFSSNESSFSPFGSMDTGADGTVRLLRAIRNRDNIKAVVLRINSPGGTVAASQEIYDEVKALKKAGKKVVVSMGDVAASGGYYISAPANYIFASPGTMTGSIGVIMSLMDYEPVLKKIGVGYRVFKSGEFKDMGAGYRAMSQAEKDMLQRMVMGSWKQFVTAVADGRIIKAPDFENLGSTKASDSSNVTTTTSAASTVGSTVALETTTKSVEPLKTAHLNADGRKPVILSREVLEKEICLGQIFLGTEALEIGLVDELGGLYDAISKAGELSGLGKNPHIIRASEVDGFHKILSMFQNMSQAASFNPLKTLFGGSSLPPLLYLYVPGGN